MESFRLLLSAFAFIAGLTTSNVFCALPSKMSAGQNDASDVTWAHAVNSWEALEKALASPIDFLEADISLGHVVGYEQTPPIPVMAHPPDTTSDISLDTWLGTVLKHGPQKGLKLDFKSIEVVEPSLIVLEKYSSKLNSSVWLNADVLSGPINSLAIPVLAERFLSLCWQYFPNATLSTGWTTQWLATDAPESWQYGWHHVREMADVIRCKGYGNNYPQFTFPVRAIFASRSSKQLQWLLSVVPNSTLTVWSGMSDPLELQDLLRTRSSFPKHKVYYDVPERHRVKFEAKKNSVDPPLQDLMADDGQWITFTRGQTESCSSLTYVRNSAVLFGRSMTTAILQRKVILTGIKYLKVTGRIQFFNTESGLAQQSARGVQEVRFVLADVSLFAKNTTGGLEGELDATTSDSEVIWSALNSSVIYTFQHNYAQADSSCQIFKLDTSQDKSFEVWTVPCDTMLEDNSFEEVVASGLPTISSRRRLVVPQGPFMLGFVSTGDEHVAIYDLNMIIPEDGSTSGVGLANTVPSLGYLSAFSTLVIAICLFLF